MHPTRSFTFSCLALVLLVGLSSQAFCAVAAVGTCTSLVNFATIQDAVNHVPAGSTIKVCPGNYPEQVVIEKNLTLEGIAIGTTQDAAVVLPPVGGMVQNTTDQRGAVAAQILVMPNPNTPSVSPIVSISNLTVDGTGNQYPAGDLRGILYQDASGTVNHVAVRNEVPNGIPTGDQSGQGIFVETTNLTSAKLTVENCSVHNYNKNGIAGRYAGTNLIATGNYVQGSGPISYIAQNGIEIAFNGATGTIKTNTVIDNFYLPTTATASDILLYDAAENASMTVSGNIVGNSNDPIALVTDTPGTYGDGVYVENNKIFGASTFDGIDLCSNGHVVTGNTIFDSAESGIHLDASCGLTGNSNTVTGNTIVESACAGILADPGTTSNTTTPDTYYTVPFPVTSSTGSCTIPAGPAVAGAKTARRFQP